MSEHVRKESEVIERRFPVERMAAVLSARYDKKRRRKVPVEHITVEEHNYRTDDGKGKRNVRIVRYADFRAYFDIFLHGDSIIERTPHLKRFFTVRYFEKLKMFEAPYMSSKIRQDCLTAILSCVLLNAV